MGKPTLSNGAETKTTAIIAFEAVFISLILKKEFGLWIMVPAVFAILSICALWGRVYNSGPDIEGFYTQHWRDSKLDANLWMSRGLQESLMVNGKRVQRRASFVNLALISIILTALSSGIIYFSVGGNGHGQTTAASKQSTNVKSTGHGEKQHPTG